VYNQIKILDLIPGAELDGVVHDQWIVTEIDGAKVYLFDQDALCSINLVGKTVGMVIDVMPIEVQEHPCEYIGFMDERRFVGKIIECIKTTDGFNSLIDINGFQVNLSWSYCYSSSSCVKVRDRMDLVEIESDKQTGWKTVG
jgi:hypothetical protein